MHCQCSHQLWWLNVVCAFLAVECANSWYSGPEAMMKTCPLCRAERGFTETMILNGLHDFLNTLSEIYNKEQDDQYQVQSAEIHTEEDQAGNA